jgi:hypothetical protein
VLFEIERAWQARVDAQRLRLQHAPRGREQVEPYLRRTRVVVEQQDGRGIRRVGSDARPVLPLAAHDLLGGAAFEDEAGHRAAQRAVVGCKLQPRVDPREVRGRVIQAARGDLDQAFEVMYAEGAQQISTLVAKHVVARERIGDERVDCLLAALEELERG